MQEKKSTIIKAEAEATSAALIGQALQKNKAFLEIWRIDAAKEIALAISKSWNHFYLDADTLLLNITGKLDENLEKVGNAPVSSQGK